MGTAVKAPEEKQATNLVILFWQSNGCCSFSLEQNYLG